MQNRRTHRGTGRGAAPGDDHPKAHRRAVPGAAPTHHLADLSVFDGPYDDEQPPQREQRRAAAGSGGQLRASSANSGRSANSAGVTSPVRQIAGAAAAMPRPLLRPAGEACAQPRRARAGKGPRPEDSGSDAAGGTRAASSTDAHRQQVRGPQHRHIAPAAPPRRRAAAPPHCRTAASPRLMPRPGAPTWSCRSSGWPWRRGSAFQTLTSSFRRVRRMRVARMRRRARWANSSERR